MALPNFDELQRLKLEQMQRSMAEAMYPSGFMSQRSPLEHIIEQVAAANKENDALRRTIQQDL